MEKIITFIKELIKHVFYTCAEAEPINDLGDFLRVKKWVKKVNILYPVFLIIALVEIIFVASAPSIFEIPTVMIYTAVPFSLILTNLGYATLIMYLPTLPKVFKSVVDSSVAGYKIGEKIETTHVDVTHEYGNTYKVSSYTENKGCLFAMIAGGIRILLWCFFCVYIGPFLIFKKYKASKQNLQNYKA